MKIIKKIGIAAGIFLLIIAVILLALSPATRIFYQDFFQNAQKEFPIPGLSEGFVPQGLDKMEEQNIFLTCGYMNNQKASRVYVIKDGQTTKAVLLKNQDGTDYTGHTGGLSHSQNFLYITGDEGLDVFPLDEVLAGKESVRQLGSVKTGLNPAYCQIQNGFLITGAFYRQGNYETPPNQRLTTPCGDENKAIAAVFQLSENAPFGIDPIPVGAISTRGLVQGICFTDDKKMVLSTSYALASSNLYFYDLEKACEKTGTTEWLGTQVPLIWLDETSLVKTVKAPPMAEEIAFRNGRILILTESASNLYLCGKFTGAGTLYSYAE